MEKVFAVAITIMAVIPSAIGEAWICVKTVDAMGRNPEMFSKLRTNMMIACALTETTAIYALLTAILILFVG